MFAVSSERNLPSYIIVGILVDEVMFLIKVYHLHETWLYLAMSENFPFYFTDTYIHIWVLECKKKSMLKYIYSIIKHFSDTLSGPSTKLGAGNTDSMNRTLAHMLKK